jgi:large repetitive protein
MSRASAVTATYGYDNDGNLTSNNGVTETYDARDEETSDSSGNAYAYTANGDLVTSGTASSTSDAYGQQIADGPSSYTWDALDRLVSVGNPAGGAGISLTYDGDSIDVASDSPASYSRDPAGQITGVDTAVGGQMIALVSTTTFPRCSPPPEPHWPDRPPTTRGARCWLPQGRRWRWATRVSGTAPSTQQVDMGARFYRPGSGFANQDTQPAKSGDAVTDNLHAYANDNPMTITDPSGHSPSGQRSPGRTKPTRPAGFPGRTRETPWVEPDQGRRGTGRRG